MTKSNLAHPYINKYARPGFHCFWSICLLIFDKYRSKFSRPSQMTIKIFDDLMERPRDVCQEKTDLCHCHTKRRMGTRDRAHPSFGMTPTF